MEQFLNSSHRKKTMEYLQQLITEAQDPQAWHWTEMRGWLIKKEHSLFGNRVLETLEELERKKDAQNYAILLTALVDIKERFTNRHPEAARAVQKTITAYAKQARDRKARRGFLIGASMLGAGVLLKLSSVPELMKLFEHNTQQDLQEALLADVRPNFIVENAEALTVLANDINEVLQQFDTTSHITPYELAQQTALMKTQISEERMENGSTITYAISQKLLLPTKYDRRYLFISDYHSWKGIDTSGRLYVLIDGEAQPVLNPQILLYSPECDIALGMCKALKYLPARVPTFTTDLRKSSAIAVTSAATKVALSYGGFDQTYTETLGPEYRPQPGEIIHTTTSFSYLRITVWKGYSGSPVTHLDGSIAGITVQRHKTIGIIVNSTHIKQMLEYAVRNFKK
jgi:hypothetical protein